MKTLGRYLAMGLSGLILILLTILIFIRLTLGGGEYYEDLSTDPSFSKDALEIVASMAFPLGNPAVSAAGRVFFNLHPLAEPTGPTVFEWVDGKAVPYPDEEFQSNFRSVLGMFIDQHNRLWTLDFATGMGERTRLLAFDLETNEVVHDHTFGPEGANLNDLQVSPDGRTVYFSDPGLFFLRSPALIVFDTETDATRRLLEGHESVTPQNWIVQTGKGDLWLVQGLVRFRLGVDGIVLSADGEWLYYGGITHGTLYRIRTEDLLDVTLTDDALADRIQRVGRKPLSDGFSIDLENNVYLTAVEHNGIARMSPDGALKTLIRDQRVRWADGISFGPDNFVYFTDSALPYIFGNLPIVSRESIEANGPYHLFRFQSDVAGIPGR